MTRLPIVLSILFLLTGCAFGGGTATPTIVPLDTTATPRLARAEPTATATPIPPPSPTPSRTPFGVVVVDAAATSEAETAAVAVTPTPGAQPRVEVISTALNVREGPGTNYAKIKTAVNGDVFTVTGADDSGNWWQVDVDGQTGWLSAGAAFTRLLGGQADDVPQTDSAASPVGAAGDTQPRAAGSAGSGRLVFATSSGGELVSVDLASGELQRLAGGVIDPAVSPDGRQVAFTRWDGSEFGAVFTIGVDGGDERAVLGEIRQPKSPTWSPDGQSLIISFQHGGLRDPKPKCRTYDFDEEVNLPTNITITWTKIKDGKLHICFVNHEDLQWNLRQIDVNSGEFADLPTGLYSYNPTWNPQQPWQVVYSGEKGLMQFDANTRQQQPLTSDLRDRESLFSPDGRRLAITYRQHDHWEIYTLDLESGERRRLTKPPILADPQFNSAAPVWSPDGQQIAFLTDRSGRWEIWVMAADGSDPRPLLPPETQAQLALDYRGVNERLLNWIE
jgi:hypothetical protein